MTVMREASDRESATAKQSREWAGKAGGQEWVITKNQQKTWHERGHEGEILRLRAKLCRRRWSEEGTKTAKTRTWVEERKKVTKAKREAPKG